MAAQVSSPVPFEKFGTGNSASPADFDSQQQPQQQWEGNARQVRSSGPSLMHRLSAAASGPLNKAANIVGAEGWWPTAMDKECSKGARILHSFTREFLPPHPRPLPFSNSLVFHFHSPICAEDKNIADTLAPRYRRAQPAQRQRPHASDGPLARRRGQDPRVRHR
jgi:hypothetical protein